MDFEGRRVVVTGGTGALGSAVVGLLLDRGAACHVTCLDESELARLDPGVRERATFHHPVDLGEEDDVRAVYGRFGDAEPLWASVHIAGGFAMAPIAETSLADWEKQLRMNATSCFLCCREAVGAFRRSGAEGRIVNVAARPALFPELGGAMAAYTASKAAVAALTGALAAEVGPEGIYVNAVVPSIIDTPANRLAMPDAAHEAWPAPDEIAETIAFLASPDNRASRAGLVPVYGRA